MTDHKAALQRIENTAIRACVGCGKQDATWTQPMLVTLPEVGGGVIKDNGPEAFAYACQTCGYLRLFVTEFSGE